MRGGAFKQTEAQKKAKQKRANEKRRYLPRKLTPRDIIREAMQEAGAWEYMPKERKVPTDLQRLLTASHIGKGLANVLTEREQQELEADLSAIGIMPGRTSGTLPERLVAKWLLDHNVEYGGMGYKYQYGQGNTFGFQIPLVGGRGDSGSVIDIFLGPVLTRTPKGTALRVNGAYFHSQYKAEAHDEAQRQKLIGAGYTVADIWDYEVLDKGALEQKMRQFTYV